MENSIKKLEDKIIGLTRLSHQKYKEGNFKGSFEDKLEARSLLESKLCDKNLKDILKKELALLYNSKFDLIYDHKKRIDDQKRYKIIKLLENKSKQKHTIGDFKGAIKAWRRSEKYR